VTLTHLVHAGRLPLLAVLAAWTTAPRALLGLPDPLAIGAEADLVLLDPDRGWTVDKAAFRSKGRNTPFHGHALKGRALATWVAGRRVWALEGAAEAATTGGAR
jgi:dihydroorotase